MGCLSVALLSLSLFSRPQLITSLGGVVLPGASSACMSAPMVLGVGERESVRRFPLTTMDMKKPRENLSLSRSLSLSFNFLLVSLVIVHIQRLVLCCG